MEYSHLRRRVALFLTAALILSMTGVSYVRAGGKAPVLSREKKTLVAGSAFRLKVKKNTADKIISTKWSVNADASSTLRLTETAKCHAIISTTRGAQIPQFKARVSAKVDYQAGKKLKTKKLVCVVTVKTTTPPDPVTTPAPVKTKAPATPTPVVTLPPVPSVTPPATPTPRSSATPSVRPSVSPTPGAVSSLNVVESYTKYYVDKARDYHTCLSIGFNKAYTNTVNYDTVPSPVPGEYTDTGYWTASVKKVAQVYRENGSLLQEIEVARVIRPNENKYSAQVIIDLGTTRYEGNFRVYLRGFRAAGTAESAQDKVFSVKLGRTELLSTDGYYRFVDPYTEPTLTHDVTIVLKNWSRPVKSLSESEADQAELVKHAKVYSGFGETLVIRNIFTDAKENSVILYVKGGTNATVFRVTFDVLAPYLFWNCPEDEVCVAGNVYEVSMNESL